MHWKQILKEVFANQSEFFPQKKHVPGGYFFYTDGSYAEREQYSGVGVYIPPQLGLPSLRFSARLKPGEKSPDRAEIQGAILVLQIVTLFGEFFKKQNSVINICTDSQKLVSFARHWAEVWAKGKWRMVRYGLRHIKRGTYPAHELYETCKDDLEELFKILKDLKTSGINVNFVWVPGHNGDEGNTISDTLAKRGRHLNFDNEQLFQSLKRSVELLSSSQPPETLLWSWSQQRPEQNGGSQNPLPRALQKFAWEKVDVLSVPKHFTNEAVVDALAVKFSPSSSSGGGGGHTPTAFFYYQKNAAMVAVRDVVILVTPQLFENLFKHTVDLQKTTAQSCHGLLPLDEHITCRVVPSVLQCRYCLVIGRHFEWQCPNKNADPPVAARCSNCAKQGHNNWTECEELPGWNGGEQGGTVVMMKCANCLDAGKKAEEAQHVAFSNKCPLRQAVQLEIIKRNSSTSTI